MWRKILNNYFYNTFAQTVSEKIREALFKIKNKRNTVHRYLIHSTLLPFHQLVHQVTRTQTMPTIIVSGVGCSEMLKKHEERHDTRLFDSILQLILTVNVWLNLKFIWMRTTLYVNTIKHTTFLYLKHVLCHPEKPEINNKITFKVWSLTVL